MRGWGSTSAFTLSEHDLIRRASSNVLIRQGAEPALPSITNSEGEGLSLLFSCPQSLLSNCQGDIAEDK